MVLAVAPNDEETEALRRLYAKSHLFVYCATYRNFVNSAEKYAPNMILLKVHEVTDSLVKKVRRIRELLPSVSLITLSDADTSALSPDVTCSARAHRKTLVFQAVYFLSASPYASVFSGSRMIGGLLLHPYERAIYLHGQAFYATPEEAFLLRYLAEIHPRRADWRELGRHCFTYGRATPRSSVASRISRINREAVRCISLPLITYRAGEGYGIAP